MIPIECKYNSKTICETLNIRNSKECKIYKDRISSIQCSCGFMSPQSNWNKIGDKIASCPKCGEVIKISTTFMETKKSKQDNNILFKL